MGNIIIAAERSVGSERSIGDAEDVVVGGVLLLAFCGWGG